MNSSLCFILLIFLCIKPIDGARRLKRKTFVRAKHDTNVRQFSPKGEIQQIQYANEAVKRGKLLIGVVAKDGVVLIAERVSQSPLLVRPCLTKLNAVGEACGIGVAGVLPDGRMLVQKAREIVQDHWFQFGEQVGIEKLISVLSRLVQKFHGFEDEDENGNGNSDREEEEEKLSRPVGVAILVAGIDHANNYALYLLEPSGAYLRWKAKAIGFGSDVIGPKLATKDWHSFSVEKARDQLLLILKEHFEEEDFTSNKLEIAVLRDAEKEAGLAKRFYIYSENKTKGFLNSFL